jgi:hypothetical protein
MDTSNEKKAMLEALQEMKSACLKMENGIGGGGDEESDGDLDNLDEMLQGKLQKKEENTSMTDTMEDGSNETGEYSEGDMEEDEESFDPSSVSSFFKDKIGSARKPLKAVRLGMIERVASKEMPKIKVMKK